MFCVDLRTNSDYFPIQPYWLVCITETECVYCAVRTGSLYIILRSAHTVYLCVLCGSENKQRLFPCTALLTGLYNWDGVCLLRATDWVFIYSSGSVLFSKEQLQVKEKLSVRVTGSLHLTTHQWNTSVRLPDIFISSIWSLCTTICVLFILQVCIGYADKLPWSW